jgi:hypothetical protein
VATSGGRARLLSDLEQLADLLRGVGEERWADRLTGVRRRVKDGEASALEELVGMIGGPGDGGLNDLVIHPSRGHDVDEDDLDELNQRVGLLTTTCFRLARGLLRRDVQET